MAGRLVGSCPSTCHSRCVAREDRFGALLDKELRKPAGERDEELVHKLREEYRKRQLENLQVQVRTAARLASAYGQQPGARACCAATGWVWQRVAASYRALHDHHCQFIQQVTEELAAAEARRPAALVVQPTLRLALPEALQQPPPHLDMCRACATKVQNVELTELQRVAHAQHMQKQYQARGLLPPPAAAAAVPRLAAAAAAAAALPVGEVQQGLQQQQGCDRSSVSSGCGKENAPAAPKQQQQQPQQQQPTLDQERTLQEGHVG